MKYLFIFLSIMICEAAVQHAIWRKLQISKNNVKKKSTFIPASRIEECQFHCKNRDSCILTCWDPNKSGCFVSEKIIASGKFKEDPNADLPWLTCFSTQISNLAVGAEPSGTEEFDPGSERGMKHLVD